MIIFINLVDFSKISGGSNHQIEILKYFSNKYICRVLTLKFKSNRKLPEFMKNKLVKFPYSYFFPISLISIPQAAYLIFLKFKKYKVVYTRVNSLSFFLVLMARMLGYHVISEHNTITGIERRSEVKFSSKIFRIWDEFNQILVAKLSSKNRCVTDEIKNYLIRKNVDSNKLFTLKNGSVLLNTRSIVPKIPKLIFKKNTNYIGYLGSIPHYEDFVPIIKSFRYHKKKQNNLKFVFIGNSNNLINIKNEIRKQNVESYFIFLQTVPVEEVSYYVKQFSICVAPFKKKKITDVGSSSIKIRDYCACGSAILSGKNSESIELEKKGILKTFRSSKPNEIMQDFQSILNNKNIITKLKRNSIVYSKSNFVWFKILSSLEKNVRQYLT